MKRGRTIAAERERAESESERMQARKKVRTKHTASILSVILLMAILGLLAYMGGRGILWQSQQVLTEEENDYQPTAEIVDETGQGQISGRMRQYIAYLEQDFRDLGYVVKRVTLPIKTSRELYVDLDGVPGFFKVSLDRDAAVTAEDAVRMIKYLEGKGVSAEYVDVRVEGKGYYK